MGEIESNIERRGNGGMLREFLAVTRGQGVNPIRQWLEQVSLLKL